MAVDYNYASCYLIQKFWKGLFYINTTENLNMNFVVFEAVAFEKLNHWTK